MLSPTDPHLCEIATPALIVDVEALEANIDRMAARARAAGIALRPHAKTHKCAEIARLQLAAGAAGIACATLAEAEALAAAGISDILLTAPQMGADKFARIAALNRATKLSLVLDAIEQVTGLLVALQAGDPVLDVLVDVDVGQARTGVTSVAQALELAQAISRAPQLRFAGIQGFGGHVQHVHGLTERKQAAADAGDLLRRMAAALAGINLAPAVITGSGTGSYAFDAAGPYNELQVGSYVFMDADYAALADEAGSLAFAPSLFALATVVSANRPGQVTVDAGVKALATNGPPPCRFFGLPEGSTYRFAGDEHGIITLPDGASTPPLGTRVLVGATHCDPTVNLHGTLHAVSRSGVARWVVLGRYR